MVLITGIMGCMGGLCRLELFLKIYMFAVFLDMFVLGIGGFISLSQAIRRKDGWARMNLTDWNRLVNQEKDLIQQSVSDIVLMVVWMLWIPGDR